MLKKNLSGLLAFCMATTMLWSYSFAEGLSEEGVLVHGVDTGYSEQQIKTVFAFYTNDNEAVAPSSVNDIVIAEQAETISESYTITLAENAKDYIVILFGGSGKELNKAVLDLGHTTHRWKTDWSCDQTGHWHGCEREDCEAKNDVAEHIPVTDITNCSSNVECDECGYIITPAADGHIYTDITDPDCNNTSCTYTRAAAANAQVTLDANFGSFPADANTTPQTGSDGKLGDLPVPIRNGYTFEGWYTNAAGGVSIDNKVLYGTDLTVYAHWKNVYVFSGGGGVSAPVEKEYTLKFNTNGGTAVNSVKGKKNLTIDLGEFSTSKKDYEFDGWCSNADLSTVVTEITLTENTTVYAKWKETQTPEEEPEDADNKKNAAFSDVNENAWYYEDVKLACESGLMNGIDENRFNPDGTTNRAMFVTVLYRLEGEPDELGDVSFSDVNEDAYYASAVAWAGKQGIVTGTDETLFSPESEITRQQMATMVYRYAVHKGKVSEHNTSVSYADGGMISDWAYEAVAFCKDKGIMSGNGDNTFAPLEYTTRAEMTAVLNRIIKAFQ